MAEKYWILIVISVITVFTIYFTSCNSLISSSEISFNKDVRPILNQHCVQCHGGVKRNAGLSLLFRHTALEPAESGKKAIIPGRPNNSELIARILHKDPEQRMPLEAPPLQEEEIQILRRWINEGAKWETHWSYLKPTPQSVPSSTSNWVKNNIDQFVLEKLTILDLTPNDVADKRTLLRRASLDLTGLPPDIEMIEKFENDNSENAFEKIIDQLLESPQYGERWASMWLDLARYADSKGYEKDNHREIWKYRDWVIDAFNDDMPFDQFTIEQLAGDLLPDPTTENYVATGFHRNTMNNSEGGVQNEEYRVAAIMDRVNTTWEVWGGTSFACAQCHGHPYDPFTQKEYYQFMDFFNQTRDEDISDDSPNLFIYDEIVEEQIDDLKKWILAQPNEQENLDSEIEKLVRIAEPKIWSYKAEVIKKTGTIGDDYILQGRHNGVAVIRNFPLYNVERYLVRCNSYQPDAKIIITVDHIDGPVVGEWKLGEKGQKIEIFKLEKQEGKRDLFFHFKSEIANNSENDGVGSFFWILPNNSLKVFDSSVNRKDEFINILKTPQEKTPILFESSNSFSRITRLFERGSWLNPGDTVKMNTPSSLTHSFDSFSDNRLGLAQWLVDKNHPLTSRVIVNRFWEQLFGAGLVSTLEDFGTQGEGPSHPELLDYLALRFQNEHNWGIKSFLKEILLSATYQQSSDASAQKLELDPYNRYLSRGPRFRLPAEQIRDVALEASGLLSNKMKGKSVMPYLPESAWNVVYPQYTSVHWALSEREDKYRRDIYTYWKRSSPYPAKMTFDVQDRNLCVSRRIRTNTPLQALVLLNDPVYVEAANSLGELMKQKSEDDIEEAIKFGYEKALTKLPDESTVEILMNLYEYSLLEMENQSKKSLEINSYDEIELESPMAIVANAILNLDAFVIKE